ERRYAQFLRHDHESGRFIQNPPNPRNSAQSNTRVPLLWHTRHAPEKTGKVFHLSPAQETVRRNSNSCDRGKDKRARPRW
ncbi:hypothetical protein DOTSEDRAFT_73314, partial [Dothistroma septosporum NZE10]